MYYYLFKYLMNVDEVSEVGFERAHVFMHCASSPFCFAAPDLLKEMSTGLQLEQYITRHLIFKSYPHCDKTSGHSYGMPV
jgi:hypothetical protein